MHITLENGVIFLSANDAHSIPKQIFVDFRPQLTLTDFPISGFYVHVACFDLQSY